jgi:16S rRNA A1518/A1519 N6-dimethyltransferase RsmA/KsgA/DIM1 with predicted DNA glycosylase/AP lyase activity
MRFLQLCFRQKRKTLVNNLKSAEFAGAADTQTAIEETGLGMAVRAEAVSLEAMASIFRRLH